MRGVSLGVFDGQEKDNARLYVVEYEEAEVEEEADVADAEDEEVEQDEELPRCGEVLCVRRECGRTAMPTIEAKDRLRLWFVNDDGGEDGVDAEEDENGSGVPRSDPESGR